MMKTSILVFALLVGCVWSQVLSQGQAANCKEPAGVPDPFQWGLCNCYSGYAPATTEGNDCSSHPRCPSLTPDTSDSTGAHSPLRPTTSFANDHLTIVQKVPIVSNRKGSHIRFLQPLIRGMPGNTPGVAGADTCFYPGLLWSKTVDPLDCIDVYTASIPWSQSKFCGFVQDTNASSVASIVLKSTLVHSFNETRYANGKAYDRVFSTSYLIAVSFLAQKTIATNNALVVTIADSSAVGFVRVSIVGDSVYDVASGETRVQFRTTAAWPYQLDAITLFTGVAPTFAGLTSVIIEEVEDYGVDCDTTQDTTCTQRWAVAIAAEATVCDIQGEYSFENTLICRDNGTAGACVGGAPPPVTFSIRVKKTDLCAPAAIDTAAQNTYSLTPFFSAEDTTPTFTYQTGDMIYWELQIIDPLVSIDKVTFNNIQIATDAGDVDVLFESNLASAKGISVGLQFTESLTTVRPGKAATLVFSYKLDRSALSKTVASLAATAGSSMLTVELTTSVIAEITYHGNQKREVEGAHKATSSISQSRTVQIILAPETDAAPAAPKAEGSSPSSIFEEMNSSASTVRSLFGLFVALFVALALKF